MEMTMVVGSKPPFELMDDYRDQATYLCKCNEVFTADSRTGENLVWDARQAVMRVVCPSCGNRRA